MWDVPFFFLVGEWGVVPWRGVVLNKGIGVDFASTLFESSLTFLEVGSVVLRTKDGDYDDECGYSADEDTLDL